ncbi:hypothetical protein [Kitasatospora sp. NPDC057223]|uniref:hypothetical protein n=1 Tax=Kitasatospora sp. NPDC057223 TaxID=3346055 RepID=UPI00363A296E
MKRLLAEVRRRVQGCGRHRAADVIPVLTADRDRWQRLALVRQAQLVHADGLIARLCAERDAAVQEAAGQRETAAAVRTLEAQLWNLQSVSLPAGADQELAAA